MPELDPLGTDLNWDGDLDPAGRYVSGRKCLAQAFRRRFETGRGTLFYDGEYGLDLREYLNRDLGTGELAALARAIEDQALQDDRVLSATATVTFVDERLRVELALVDAAGPFDLTLAVSDLTVEVLDALGRAA